MMSIPTLRAIAAEARPSNEEASPEAPRITTIKHDGPGQAERPCDRRPEWVHDRAHRGTGSGDAHRTAGTNIAQALPSNSLLNCARFAGEAVGTIEVSRSKWSPSIPSTAP